MENHTTIGGLGTIVAEVIAERGMGQKLVRIGLRDTFAHGASLPYLKKEYGLDALSLVHEIGTLLKTRFDISESELAEIYLAPVHSVAKAEAL